MIDLRGLKKNAIFFDEPLRSLILSEPDFLSERDFLSKSELWLKLAKMEVKK